MRSLLASVCFSGSVTLWTVPAWIGSPDSGKIWKVSILLAEFATPRNLPNFGTSKPAFVRYQTQSYHPKLRYYEISGVSPVRTPKGVLPCRLAALDAVNCISLAKWGSP